MCIVNSCSDIAKLVGPAVSSVTRQRFIPIAITAKVARQRQLRRTMLQCCVALQRVTGGSTTPIRSATSASSGRSPTSSAASPTRARSCSRCGCPGQGTAHEAPMQRLATALRSCYNGSKLSIALLGTGCRWAAGRAAAARRAQRAPRDNRDGARPRNGAAAGATLKPAASSGNPIRPQNVQP
jgi:hypothetical protein